MEWINRKNLEPDPNLKRIMIWDNKLKECDISFHTFVFSKEGKWTWVTEKCLKEGKEECDFNYWMKVPEKPKGEE